MAALSQYAFALAATRAGAAHQDFAEATEQAAATDLLPRSGASDGVVGLLLAAAAAGLAVARVAPVVGAEDAAEGAGMAPGRLQRWLRGLPLRVS